MFQTKAPFQSFFMFSFLYLENVISGHMISENQEGNIRTHGHQGGAYKYKNAISCSSVIFKIMFLLEKNVPTDKRSWRPVSSTHDGFL